VRLVRVLWASAILVAACKRRTSIEALPHVERIVGAVEPATIPWSPGVGGAKVGDCYDEALAHDPTEAGTLTLTVRRPGTDWATLVDVKTTGSLSGAIAPCLQKGGWYLSTPGESQTIELTLRPEKRREPAPPTAPTFRRVVEWRFRRAPVRVVDFTANVVPPRRYSDTWSISASCTAEIEVNDTFDDDLCGTIRTPGAPWWCKRPFGCGCDPKEPPVRRHRGERVKLAGDVRLILTPRGWRYYANEETSVDPDTPTFFGDVEVDP
jgi:hypothetical protein